ncbi:hypothetical protein ACFL6I_09310 [candidate division KSB1 bacterium]
MKKETPNPKRALFLESINGMKEMSADVKKELERQGFDVQASYDVVNALMQVKRMPHDYLFLPPGSGYVTNVLLDQNRGSKDKSGNNINGMKIVEFVNPAEVVVQGKKYPEIRCPVDEVVQKTSGNYK